MIAGRVYRILDANFNRSREGLRVCEEVARFVLEDAALTGSLKACRHAVTDVWKDLFEKNPALLTSRDVRGDVGKKPERIENRRKDFWQLFWANAQRSKESMRALEETVKLLDERYVKRFKKIRFRLYAIEKRSLPKLEALRDQSAGRRPARKSAKGHPRRGRRHPAAR